MPETPKVSVIIPLYNVENYLEKCVDSILGQTYTNFEIIMCDDCSSDDTLKKAYELAKKDSRIVVLKNGKISEQGSHLSLLRRRGEYAKLWSKQGGSFLETDAEIEP